LFGRPRRPARPITTIQQSRWSPVETSPAAIGRRVYLDAATTAPLSPHAREAFLAALEDGWADPRRLHREGRRARMLLDGARQSLAASLGARPEEVVLTATHARAVTAAVGGIVAARRRVGRRVVVSAVEHSAVLHAAAHHGDAVHTAAVDEVGRVDVAELGSAARESPTALVCLQAANGEVGTLQPVEDAACACRTAGVPLLVDAGAAAGHAPLPATWDALTADAGAWGGPGDVGVLCLRAGTRWLPFEPEHESVESLAGAPGIPAVVAAAVALEAALAALPTEAPRRARLVERVREAASRVPDTQVVGDGERRLPHVVTFSCLYADGEALLDAFDRQGFAVGSGSACTAATLRPSHVLAAMGVLTHGNLRLGLPIGVAEGDVNAFLAALPDVVAGVRAQMGATGL
jgi:cysteine desulfurase